MIISLDTEDTGLDFKHGCKPYLVTTCDDKERVMYWEWPVDVFTRQPIVPPSDVLEIEERINAAEYVVFQNAKFDISALSTIGIEWKEEWWPKVHDTLYSGHLLASGEPHDLTYYALRYLGVDIKPFEDNVERMVRECLKAVKRDLPKWRVAKEGDPLMPSIKSTKNKAEGKLWKLDMWLLRAYARTKKLPKGVLGVVDFRKEKCDVRIDRTTKWGNPFVIGRDGTRAEVIDKYRNWIRTQPQLMKALPELQGKVLGCFCKPEDCHGDVLQELVPAHEYWTGCSDYANTDSSITLPVWTLHEKLLKERGLWELYLERIKLVRVIYSMEKRGVTYSQTRLQEMSQRFKQEAEESSRVCLALGKGVLTKLPDSGTSKEMKKLLFEDWKLPVISKSEKTGEPSVDKTVLESWESTLPKGSKQQTFVRHLRRKRKRDTGVGYMESYERFGLPPSCNCDDTFKPVRHHHDCPAVSPSWKEFRRLHPSLNSTGSNTLRFTSANPNEQNISKQAEADGTSIRTCFGPGPGREWWSIDFKNLELVLPAYHAGERVMIDLFERPNDPPYFGSYHLLNASIVYPKEFQDCIDRGEKFKDKYASTIYQWVKNGGFAKQYGAIEESGTVDAAFHKKGAHRMIDKSLTEITKLNRACIDFANEHGYVETIRDKEFPCGYPLQCPRSKWGKVLVTVPLNYKIQGTAMWCTCRSMVRCHNFLEQWNKAQGYMQYWESMLKGIMGGFITMQVHDELVFDLPVSSNPQGNYRVVLELKRLMELSGDDLGIPISTDVSYHPVSWGDKVKVELDKAA